jgi:hypothetical protein
MVGKREKEAIQFLEPVFQYLIDSGHINPKETWEEFEARKQANTRATNIWSMTISGGHFHYIHLWRTGLPEDRSHPMLLELQYEIEYKVSETEYRRFKGCISLIPQKDYQPICGGQLYAECYVKGVKTKYIHPIERTLGFLERVPTKSSVSV